MIQEDRISVRQLRRTIFTETFGIGALSVPALACYKGQSGFWALVFYGIFLAAATGLFITYSEKMRRLALRGPMQNLRDAEKNCLKEKSGEVDIMYAKSCPLIIKIVYIIRFFINAIALFYFFGKTVQTVYMPESGFFFILFPAAVLLWYSLHTSLQKRARFLELIFPWIIAVVLLAIILSFLGIEKTMALGEESRVWSGIFSDNIFQSMGNGYLILLCSSPVEFLLFTGSVTESGTALRKSSEGSNKMIKRTKTSANSDAHLSESMFQTRYSPMLEIIVAIAGAFLCNVIFSFLAIRTLGQTLTGQSAWPVIKMMQLIRMPGGFLERFDILPIVFWILCMAAVLSGYLYYGKHLVEQVFYGIRKTVLESGITESGTEKVRTTESGTRKIEYFSKKVSFRYNLVTGIGIALLLLLSCLVENIPFLWTFYLKYKIFVDFPLSLLLPLFVCFCGKKDLEQGKIRGIEEEKDSVEKKIRKTKEEKDSGEKKISKTEEERDSENKKIREAKEEKYLVKGTLKTEKPKIKKMAAYLLIFIGVFPVIFSLTGCQRLTDVEEKNYILSMYVDYPSAEENVYEFWIAHADLSKMEERDDEIPCQITEIRAGNLQELEEKYMELIPGKTEWNHIYTIFLGTGIATDKKACTRFLKEWDAAWQKSPNVLLALCPEFPKKLYTVKNIPEGAAGQEASLLAEQNKETLAENICETPIDYLRAIERKKEKIALYRITIEDGIKMGKGVV